ncbi:hypothetical protein M0R88_04400 [Halorussus gelatinilyticus]|uniref:Uncharacterized protein n=1 Tax=Halorussus gelatinilyticus TaxID=2937524 RepID=A0A8U0IMU6_9EURY|nr:hypothetical protein [Halorussus gelatinilyticus]UPW01349.1 hypothetical protein M0R88_04400 [Halorussus gelatinilyticus]
MAIIELNLEKPALKRVESVEDEQVEEKNVTAEIDTDETAEMVDAETEIDQESQSGGKSRVRKYGRRLVVLGGTAAGVAAARKLRQRRKSGSEQQDLEEDWQTAE